jgi:NNP family nitrate/nitrite transporter-like MFS transporter
MTSDYEKPKGTPGQAVAAATLGCFIGIGGIGLFAPVAKKLKDVLGLQPSEMALLIAMPSLSASLLRVPFGASVDENGGKKPMVFLLCVSMLGLMGLCVLLNRSEEELQQMGGVYSMLLFCGVLTGFGGAVFSVGAGQCSYWYPPESQGSVLGLYGGIGNLMPGMMALGMPFAIRGIGMPKTYILWLGLLGLGTAAYFFFGHNAWYFQLRRQGTKPQEAEQIAREIYGQQMFPKGSAMQSLKMAASNVKTWALVTLYFLNYGGYLALTTWLATFWMEYHGFEDIVAGLLTALYSEGQCLTRAFLGGLLADRIGGENALLGAFPGVGLGALLIVVTDAPVFHVVASVILSLSMGICAGSIFKLVPIYVPEALGGAAGWIGGLGAFGSFALPPILGMFVTMQGRRGYKNGFIVYTGLALIGWGIVMLLVRQKRLEENSDHSSEDSSGYSSDGSEDSDEKDQ